MTGPAGDPAVEDGAEPRADSREAHGLQTSTRDPQDIGFALQAWLRQKHPAAQVTHVEVPEHSGMSSLTVMIDVVDDVGGSTSPQHLVARIAPDASALPVFETYDLQLQYDVLAHLRTTDVPVPHVVGVDNGPNNLGVPFFLMERIEGVIPPDVMPYSFGSWLSQASHRDQKRLSDSTLQVLAKVHDVHLTEELTSRLTPTQTGDSALKRHLNAQKAYYEWCAADAGIRSTVIEACFDWLEQHWPAHVHDAGLSWGDARIGNIIFEDFTPRALLDWEMVSIAPPEVDLGWMIFFHRWFDDLAVQFGVEPMSHFFTLSESVQVYETASGRKMRDLKWFLFYAALRHGIIMWRIARRPVALGQAAMPDDPNDLIMHRATLEQMLAGDYWATFGL